MNNTLQEMEQHHEIALKSSKFHPPRYREAFGDATTGKHLAKLSFANNNGASAMFLWQTKDNKRIVATAGTLLWSPTMS